MDQIFCQALGEKFLIFIRTGTCVERQYRNGIGFYRRFWRVDGWCKLKYVPIHRSAYAHDPHGLIQSFETMFPPVLECARRHTPHLVEQSCGNINFTGIGHLLQSRGDIDAVAAQIISYPDNIGQMQAKAHRSWCEAWRSGKQ